MGHTIEKSSDSSDASSDTGSSENVIDQQVPMDRGPIACAHVPSVRTYGTLRSGNGQFANMRREGRLFTSSRNLKRWSRKIDLTERRAWLLREIAAAEPESKPSGDSTTLVKQNSSIVY
ncbi:60S ribosomal protein L4-like [Aphidius gifuensis]|uniref:60S ribosomal protein L4-like n=1 Tax=Aphidius gifuensis TaxID=684658 RepID=UPI001CDB70AD|nr:60S ribosomal protein L4-like [Aphidius gifuensis]